MQYTQAQIDRANAVSLEDFLRTQGETLIKSGREYRWKEHDSLTVRGNKWFRHSQSKGCLLYTSRYVSGIDQPIYPIAYIKNKIPMAKKAAVCSYTVEGLSLIHIYEEGYA